MIDPPFPGHINCRCVIRLAPPPVPVSPLLAHLFGLRWMLDRECDDPCDEVDGLWRDLPDGLWYRDGKLVFECRSCERATEFDCGPNEFDYAMAYCGGSPRCLP